MPRKSSKATLRPTGALTAQERVWAAIRAQREFDADSLFVATRQPVGVMRTYIGRLNKGAFIERIAPARRDRPARYALLNDVGVEAPRLDASGRVQGDPVHERLWRTVKILGEFTARDLIAVQPPGQAHIALNTVRCYCSALLKAGYVIKTRQHKTGVDARYRKIGSRCTGEKSPSIRADGSAIFDSKRDQVVWTREGGSQW